MTSQSIEGHDFPDFEMFDAKISSALKKIISNQHLRRRECVEERTSEEGVEGQHAQKHDRFLRGRQIAFLIYDHFQATGAHEAALDSANIFNVSLQGDDIDTRWDQAPLSASEVPKQNVL